MADPGTLVSQEVDELLVDVIPELLSGGNTLGHERRIGVRHQLKRGSK